MARRRMTDPAFYTDDKIIQCSIEERYLFKGMWNFADDEGVIQNNAMLMKVRIFPADEYTEAQIREWMDHLILLDMILVDESGALLKIKNWTEYQKINRPSPSKYQFTERSVSDHGTIIANRKEVKRKEKKSNTSSKTQNGVKAKPKDLNEVIEYFKEKKIQDHQENAIHFFGYYDSQGWKKANGRPVVDWKSCVTTWKFDAVGNGEKKNKMQDVVCPQCKNGKPRKFQTDKDRLTLVRCPECNEYGVLSMVDWKIENARSA